MSDNSDIQISILTQADLAEVQALSEAAKSAPKSGFLPVSAPVAVQDIETLLQGRAGCIFGARVNGRLVAHMAAAGPLTLWEAIRRGLLSRMNVTFHHAGLGELVAVFAAMTVSPACVDKDVAVTLVAHALRHAMVANADHVFAETPAMQIRLNEAFLRQGFGLVAAGHDPEDLTPRFIMQRPARGFNLATDAGADDVDPLADFSAISILTQHEGFVGRPGDNDGPLTKLAFYRSRELTARLPTKTIARIGS